MRRKRLPQQLIDHIETVTAEEEQHSARKLPQPVLFFFIILDAERCIDAGDCAERPGPDRAPDILHRRVPAVHVAHLKGQLFFCCCVQKPPERGKIGAARLVEMHVKSPVQTFLRVRNTAQLKALAERRIDILPRKNLILREPRKTCVFVLSAEHPARRLVRFTDADNLKDVRIPAEHLHGKDAVIVRDAVVYHSKLSHCAPSPFPVQSQTTPIGKSFPADSRA